MERNLEAIRQELTARKQELEEKLTRMAKEKVTDDQVQDPGDKALSSTMESLKSSFQDTELEEYNRIIQALKKIEEGTYGLCVDCGEEISPKRLKSYPNAARCLVCQETFEEKTSE
ncbi:MAG TPA: TraR/DksA C4-type zinc finger protein [Candidatus Dependentiae bacterium]|nr:TraR/DksA C4-type zinc finger protein [Candidatus Dependentiae bacterium]HRQ62647.1 TraR/DksA C4-type zinc finger protein [Candidatus Dependentiae bacterium]